MGTAVSTRGMVTRGGRAVTGTVARGGLGISITPNTAAGIVSVVSVRVHARIELVRCGR